jgi:hypothetical protein
VSVYFENYLFKICLGMRGYIFVRPGYRSGSEVGGKAIVQDQFFFVFFCQVI